MFDSKRGETDPGEEHPGGPIKYPDRWSKQIYFDNDLENYPLSEGDLINIRTERDYSQEEPKPSYFFTFLIELDPL